jgi:hypothetical protein
MRGSVPCGGGHGYLRIQSLACHWHWQEGKRRVCVWMLTRRAQHRPMDHKSGGNYKTKSSGFDEWLIVARAEQIGRLRSAHGEL